MEVVIVFVCLFALANAASTAVPTTKNHHHHNHVTHEPDEKESLDFKYDHETHTMVARIGHDECYLYVLSAQEQIDVHTHDGIRSIEFKMMQFMTNMPTSAPDVTTTQANHHHQDPHSIESHLCHGSKHIYHFNQM